MIMQWEHLTTTEFVEAREKAQGVCILPIGVIEKHGETLPLGQDSIFAHDIAVLAAKEEPAVVFPMYYFGMICEARHQAGTIAIPPELQLQLLEATLDEIGRNGFKKILIVNGHGGNGPLLGMIGKTMLAREKPYSIYTFFPFKRYPVLTAQTDGHGGEQEISQMLYFHPELVKNDGIPAGYGLNMPRLEAVEKLGASTPMDWYAYHPGHLAADQTPGTVEKGEVIVQKEKDRIVALLREIKQNDTAEELYREFHARARDPKAYDI